ncbi:hypothetical protein E8E12_010593 [Didymella heteroderae]|uniref:Uncharacterized protein n=1 Tax=Didymella heteroderae TaxID=1769908 RepID=A0A9P4WWH7_9PLEO|nr:hypothetical protein E8E12_010593 [Didymella heteroderae]
MNDALDKDTQDESTRSHDTAGEDIVEQDAVNEDSTEENPIDGNDIANKTLNEDTSGSASDQDDPELNTIDTTTVDDPTCDPSCILYAPKISVVSWVPDKQIIYTANVTVGIITTLVFLCDDIMVATRLQTEYHWDSAPAGMYPPYLTTNARGNAVAIVPFTDASVTSVVELVYPNSHIAYDTFVSWQGIVQDFDSLGVPVCLTATPEPSTVHLTSNIPIPRSYYPEPTATRGNRSNTSGQGFHPLWVSLDFQPPVAMIEHPIYIQHFPIGITGCHKTAILDSNRPIFYEPRYIFDYKTLSIDLGASGMGSRNGSAARWHNSSQSEALCVGYTEKFAGLCERPEIPLSSDKCAHKITIWDDTGTTDISFANSGGDRTAGLAIPKSATGFETAYNVEESVTPFFLPTPDWIVDGKGGIVTSSRPPATQAYRNPDAAEAAAIANYFKGRTDERVGSWSRPQHTQPPTKPAPGLMPIESKAVSQYFREPLGYHAHPLAGESPTVAVGDEAQPSSRVKSAGLDAIGSAFNRIFFQGKSTARTYQEAPIVYASRIGIQIAPATAIIDDVPNRKADQDVNAAAKVLASATPTTPRQFLYIQISATMNDIATAVGGYILPMTSTVLAGQKITVDGQVTQLPAPELLPIYLATTISGILTSTVGYIVSGRSTATVGETIALNGGLTVLATPDAVFTQLTTLANDISAVTPAYIISGTIASIGQRATLNGTPMVLAAPNAVPTYITTTTNGVEESGLAYIITGSMTATIGQTVVIEGSTTVLVETTSQPGVVEGGARRTQGPSCNAVFIGIGAALAVWL